jgi:hypothetical protein
VTSIQRVALVNGVRERCMPGVGATPPSGLPRRLTPRWSLPPPAHHVSKKYLTQIFHLLALDTNRISSAWLVDLQSIRDRFTNDRKHIHRRNSMSKLKLEHGISRIRRAKLQSSIDQTVADDIELLAEWSNNEPNYVINELLRFALTQEEDFLRYKTSSATTSTRTAAPTRPATTPIKSVSEPGAKPDEAVSSTAART